MNIPQKNSDYSRHLLPWFPLNSTEFEQFGIAYTLQCLRLTPEHAAALCGASTATIKRWIKTDTAPLWFMPYMLACCGFSLVNGWEGWRIDADKLYQPQSRAHSLLYNGFSQADFRKLEFTRINYATTEHKIDDLARENEALRKVHHKPHKKLKVSNVVNFADFQKQENA